MGASSRRRLTLIPSTVLSLTGHDLGLNPARANPELTPTSGSLAAWLQSVVPVEIQINDVLVKCHKYPSGEDSESPNHG